MSDELQFVVALSLQVGATNWRKLRSSRR